MKNSKSLLLAVSTNAVMSKWMPWELGFVDGKTDRCAIIPVSIDNLSHTSFNRIEYLKLYPYIEIDFIKVSNTYKLWVYDDDNSFVIFDSWITGFNPYRR